MIKNRLLMIVSMMIPMNIF